MKMAGVITPEDGDLQQLANGVRGYNQAFVPQTSPEKIAIFIKAGAVGVLGGCYGVINWGWLYRAIALIV